VSKSQGRDEKKVQAIIRISERTNMHKKIKIAFKKFKTQTKSKIVPFILAHCLLQPELSRIWQRMQAKGRQRLST